MREPCLLCSTINHFDFTGIEEAYECSFCKNRMWVDDSGRLEYMISRQRTLSEAEADLQAGLPIFCKNVTGEYYERICD